MDSRQYQKKLNRLFAQETALRQHSKDTIRNNWRMWDCIVKQYKLNLRYFKFLRRSGRLVNLPGLFDDLVKVVNYSISQRELYR